MYRQAYKCNLSEFLPNLTSNLCPVEFDRQVKLGVNHWGYDHQIRPGIQCNLKPLTGNVISMDLHPIQPNLTGQNQPVKLAVNHWGYGHQIRPGIQCNLKPLTGNVISMDLHPIRPVEFNWSNAFNRQCNLNGFTPNSTDRIRPVECL